MITIDQQIKTLKEAQTRRKEIMKLYKSGKTLREIAEIKGITFQRVHQIIKRAKMEAEHE